MKPAFGLSLLCLGGWAVSLVWLCTTLKPDSPSLAPMFFFTLCGWLMWCLALPGGKKDENHN